MRVTPIIPGNAPAVLVSPKRREACFGDKSAWFEYKPATEQLAKPSAMEISPAVWQNVNPELPSGSVCNPEDRNVSFFVQILTEKFGQI